MVNITGDHTFKGAVDFDSTMTFGATAITETDLAKIDGITNGTQAANKAVVTDANVNSGISKVTELHIGATGSETQVTATGAEINYIAGVTLGTVTASKVVTADANKDVASLRNVTVSTIVLSTASTLTALATAATLATVTASVQEIIAFLQAKLGAS